MIYLIHFQKPFKHAKHYLGFSTDSDTLRKRITSHEHHTASSKGSRLMKYVSEAGIKWKVVRLWADGTRTMERQLKNRGGSARHCPICKGETTWRETPDLETLIDLATEPPAPRPRRRVESEKGVDNHSVVI